eukprot:490247-Pyramimonas_sp.AAC.1
MVESFLTPSSPAGTTSTDCEFAAIAFALIHALHVGGCSSVKKFSDSEVAVKTLLREYAPATGDKIAHM